MNASTKGQEIPEPQPHAAAPASPKFTAEKLQAIRQAVGAGATLLPGDVFDLVTELLRMQALCEALRRAILGEAKASGGDQGQP